MTTTLYPCFCGHPAHHHKLRIDGDGQIHAEACQHCGCRCYDEDQPATCQHPRITYHPTDGREMCCDCGEEWGT